MGLYVFSLLLMPLLEVFYIRGRVGLFNGFYVSIGAAVLCAVAEAFVHSGVVGSAGELPERYMQAVVSGFAGSGNLFYYHSVRDCALQICNSFVCFSI